MYTDKMVRLQKFMALSGIASRRKAEEMILEGKVKVNGEVIKTLGVKIDQGTDVVEVAGQKLAISQNKIYIMLNKPAGYVSTASDQFGRKTVMDLLRDVHQRVYPVGRLDYESEGLLLLSNDGDFTYKILHPRHSVDKTYIATVKGIPNKEQIVTLRKGVNIEDYVTSPAKVEIIKIMKESCILQIIIHEGKNRQVRKMCEAVGHPVIKLKREAIGKIQLGHVPIGKWRHLKQGEIQYLIKDIPHNK